MAERLNLVVDEGVGALLTELAGGERRRGQYLSMLVRGLIMADDLATGAITPAFAVKGLASRVAGLEGRLEAAEAQLAAVIAQRAE
jgi:hypothetical protein